MESLGRATQTRLHASRGLGMASPQTLTMDVTTADGRDYRLLLTATPEGWRYVATEKAPKQGSPLQWRGKGKDAGHALVHFLRTVH